MVNEFETNALVRAFTNHIEKMKAAVVSAFTHHVKLYRIWLHKKSYERAVKHANHVRRSTGHKCYVLFFDATHKYKAITKQHVKHLLAIKYFKPGTSLKDIEALAAYTTN
jgi:hypothetical protein